MQLMVPTARTAVLADQLRTLLVHQLWNDTSIWTSAWCTSNKKENGAEVNYQIVLNMLFLFCHARTCAENACTVAKGRASWDEKASLRRSVMGDFMQQDTCSEMECFKATSPLTRLPKVEPLGMNKQVRDEV